jgi:hypothetical protein
MRFYNGGNLPRALQSPSGTLTAQVAGSGSPLKSVGEISASNEQNSLTLGISYQPVVNRCRRQGRRRYPRVVSVHRQSEQSVRDEYIFHTFPIPIGVSTSPTLTKDHTADLPAV